MRGALVIAVVFSSTAITVGVSQYAFGLFIVPLEETFGWTRTEISASLSFAAVGGLAAPLLGRAMDRFGVRPILVVSLAVFGLSFCLRPLMTELWHWYAVSFLQFVTSFGMTVLPTGRLVAAWYPHIRGRMMGVAATGNNVGGLLMPVFVAALLVAMPWSDASVVIGIAAFAVAGAAALAIREAPPTAGPFFCRDRVPATGAGLPAAGSTAAPRGPAWHSDTKCSPKWAAEHAPVTPFPDNGIALPPTAAAQIRRADTAHAHATRLPSVLPELNVRESVRTRAFYVLLTAISLGVFTYSTILPHVLAHLVNKGMENASALAALGTLAIGGIFGKLLFGWISDRFGARRMMMLNLIGQAASTALLAGADHAAVLAVAAPLYGLFLGGFGTLYILVVQEAFGLRHYGSIMGLMNVGTVVPLGLGPLIAGVSYDISGAYDAAFFVVCGLFVAAAVSLAFVRPHIPKTGAVPRQRP